MFAMTTSIGSAGPRGAGLANTAPDMADTAVDPAEVQPEHATGLLAMLKAQPSRAERQRMAEEPSELANDDSAAPDGNGQSASGNPSLEVAPLASSIAGVFERGVHAPMHRMPSDAALIRRLDRRRKRSC
jgi:hypothetical protein